MLRHWHFFLYLFALALFDWRQNEKGVPGGRTRPFTSQWTVRLLKTLLLLSFALRNYNQLALDRFVRMGVHDVNTGDRMIRRIAQIDIIREADWNLGLGDSIRARVNLAGVRIGDPATDAVVAPVDVPLSLEACQVAIICLKAVDAAQGILSEDEQLGYLQVQGYLRGLDSAARRSRLRTEVNYHLISTSVARIVTILEVHSWPGPSRCPSDGCSHE
jgi:hypothetical protein